MDLLSPLRFCFCFSFSFSSRSQAAEVMYFCASASLGSTGSLGADFANGFAAGRTAAGLGGTGLGGPALGGAFAARPGAGFGRSASGNANTSRKVFNQASCLTYFYKLPTGNV